MNPCLSTVTSTKKTLSFSSICNLLYNVWDHDIWLIPSERLLRTSLETSPKRRERDVVNLLYSLVYKNDDLYDVPDLDNNRVTELFQGKINVKDVIRRKAATGGTHLIRENFEQRVAVYLNEAQKKQFWIGLQDLLAQTPLGEDVLRLESFKGVPYVEGQTSKSSFCSFAASSILFAMSISKDFATKGKESSLDFTSKANYLNSLPDDVRSHYDPYTLSGRHSHSTAVAFQLMPDGVIEATKTFHSLERLLDLILKKSYLITKIECTSNIIILHYRDAKADGYILRRIRPRDINDVYKFIKDHHDEFHAKLSWKGKAIEDMAKNGLTDKWTGYAYFYSEGKLASYLDYKIRIDSDIELGIALTDDSSRKRSLSTGLINLFRIMFMSQRLFAGTYEENIAMRKTLESCNFQPNYFQDNVSGIETCLVRERIDPNDPNDNAKLTNSIYYYANSLLFDVRCAYDSDGAH